MNKQGWICLLLVALCANTYNQSLPAPEYRVLFFTLISHNSQTPFWLHANQQGLFHPEGNTAALNLGFHAPEVDQQTEQFLNLPGGNPWHPCSQKNNTL